MKKKKSAVGFDAGNFWVYTRGRSGLYLYGLFSHLYFRHTSKSLTVSIYRSSAGLRLPMINQFSVCGLHHPSCRYGVIAVCLSTRKVLRIAGLQ